MWQFIFLEPLILGQVPKGDFEARDSNRSEFPERCFTFSHSILAAAPGSVEMTGINPLEVEIVVVSLITLTKVDVVDAEEVIVEVGNVVVVLCESILMTLTWPTLNK